MRRELVATVDNCYSLYRGMKVSKNTKTYKSQLMKKVDVVSPNENFRGRSYGEWASEWLKWVVSSAPDTYSKDDPIIFLRANIDYSPVEGREGGYRENTTTHYDRTGDRGIEIYEGTAVFYPVVEANFLTGCKNPEVKTKVLQTEEELRYYARKDIDSGWEIGTSITVKNGKPRPLVKDLKEYRAESQLFRILVSKSSPLKNKMEEELRAGIFGAVTDGYWILIREFRAGGPYRIYFEARKGDYYYYSATYDIFVQSRPKGNFKDKSYAISHKHKSWDMKIFFS